MEDAVDKKILNRNCDVIRKAEGDHLFVRLKILEELYRKLMQAAQDNRDGEI